jgi:hypothetical protein
VPSIQDQARSDDVAVRRIVRRGTARLYPSRRCRDHRERFALLTQRWAALQHVTADPARLTEITRAALVLTQFEHKYISYGPTDHVSDQRERMFWRAHD